MVWPPYVWSSPSSHDLIVHMAQTPNHSHGHGWSPSHTHSPSLPPATKGYRQQPSIIIPNVKSCAQQQHVGAMAMRAHKLVRLSFETLGKGHELFIYVMPPMWIFINLGFLAHEVMSHGTSWGPLLSKTWKLCFCIKQRYKAEMPKPTLSSLYQLYFKKLMTKQNAWAFCHMPNNTPHTLIRTLSPFEASKPTQKSIPSALSHTIKIY